MCLWSNDSFLCAKKNDMNDYEGNPIWVNDYEKTIFINESEKIAFIFTTWLAAISNAGRSFNSPHWI